MDSVSEDIALSDVSKMTENAFGASVIETAWTETLFKEDSSFINLIIGAPGPDILAGLSPLFRRGADHWLSSDVGGNIFQYGPEAGIRAFRVELAKMLSNRYSELPVTPDSLLVTTGATNGLHLAASVLVRHGGRGVVFVEDPTYFIALNVLSGDLGLKVVPVGMNEDGMDCEELDRLVTRERELCGDNTDDDDDQRFWGLIYTIPNFHNPTGISFSKETGNKMIEIAARNEMLVLCDDVYNLLSYQEQPKVDSFSRLLALDTHEVVLSNGTFSKILAPGVRLGWLEGPPSLIRRLSRCGVLASGGSQANLMTGLITGMMQLGLIESHLDTCTSLYRHRMEQAMGVLTSGLPHGWRVLNPQGGYFLWVQATSDLNLTTFSIWLREKWGVAVLAGSRASSSGKGVTVSCCRISIAHYTVENVVKGCKLLCEAAKKFVEDGVEGELIG